MNKDMEKDLKIIKEKREMLKFGYERLNEALDLRNKLVNRYDGIATSNQQELSNKLNKKIDNLIRFILKSESEMENK
ncbi:hypothetical protein [Spiroplasma endosymbiont of Dasysyrphus albostriatus]|uniref:hypothetical protein n=1 Tax=Spiroplasma endosymbiont of Dasysyrphus albostriatus TaxID=3066299 RepID=UPI0030CAF7EC